MSSYVSWSQLVTLCCRLDSVDLTFEGQRRQQNLIFSIRENKRKCDFCFESKFYKMSTYQVLRVVDVSYDVDCDDGKRENSVTHGECVRNIFANVEPRVRQHVYKIHLLTCTNKKIMVVSRGYWSTINSIRVSF